MAGKEIQEYSGFGEVGLDFGYSSGQKQKQIDGFRELLQLFVKLERQHYNLVLLLHVRDRRCDPEASDRCLQMIQA